MQFPRCFPHMWQSGVTLMTPLDGGRIDLETPPNGKRFFPAVLINQQGFTELLADSLHLLLAGHGNLVAVPVAEGSEADERGALRQGNLDA